MTATLAPAMLSAPALLVYGGVFSGQVRKTFPVRRGGAVMVARLLRLLACLLVVALCCTAPAEAQKRPTPGENAPLQKAGFDITLSSGAATIQPGQKMEVLVTLKNCGKEPLLVLQPLDGSDYGWRVANYEWKVRRNGVLQEPQELARCGNINSIRKADFVTLKGGESWSCKSPGSFLGEVTTWYSFTEPGKYEITLTYSFNPNRKETGIPLGKNEAGVAALLRQALVIQKTSAPLVITVEKAAGR
jgi:hypothetical protein